MTTLLPSTQQLIYCLPETLYPPARPRFGMRYIDMVNYHIDMVILDIDMGYGRMIREIIISVSPLL